jgi:replicative DNA helicase
VLEMRPSPQQIGRFMKEVQESYGNLQLISLAQDAIQNAKNGHTFTEAATTLEEDVIDLTQRAGGSESRPSTKVIQEVLEDLEEEQGERVTGIPTPFPKLNRITRGLHDGELIIPFGSTSMGKTAWALTVALHAASEGHGVAIHTLEMSEKALFRRLIQMESGVNLRQTTIPDREMEKVTKASARIGDMPLEIIEASGLDYLSHRSSLRRLQYEKGIDLAVVDYLQIMSAPPSASYDKKHHEVHESAQGLKDTAKILGMPVITPSQTTKRVDNQHGEKRPTLSDLREAGEEPADVAVGLYRPEYYGITQWPEGGSTEGEGLAIVSKQRNGPTGEAKLAYVAGRVRWEPLADRNEDDAPF